MEEATYGRKMTVDRCTGCQGLWFDLGEAERLKDKWMSEFLDTGDAKAGKANNDITDCPCPRCGKTMEHIKDADQPHIGFEVCAEHGMHFDAGEFTDYKHVTLFEKVTQFIHRYMPSLKLLNVELEVLAPALALRLRTSRLMTAYRGYF